MCHMKSDHYDKNDNCAEKRIQKVIHAWTAHIYMCGHPISVYIIHIDIKSTNMSYVKLNCKCVTWN